jgi:hypothetical protein
MILSLPGDSSFQQKYVFCLRKRIDKETFLRRAKVKPGTYAGDLITNLYESIFERSVELKSDYKTYYAVEYKNFEVYLHKRLLLAQNITSMIVTQFENSIQIVYFHPSYYFLREEYGLNFLAKLLEPKVAK